MSSLGRYVVAACLMGAAAAAAQETFPDRELTLVVPFGPGSAPDTQSRLVGQALSEQLGQSVIVQNKPGANSMIGTAYVAHSVPADGYTLLYGTNSGISAARAMNQSLTYDPLRDLAPVASLQEAYFVLLARPDVAGKTFAGVLEHIRTHPGTFKIGGASVTMEVTSKMMANAGKLDYIYVPYKQLSQMVTDIKGGVLDAGFSTIGTALPLVQAGEMVALAATSPERLEVLPEVPSMTESLPGVTLATWTGFFVPAGTPQDRIELLNREIAKAMQRPQIRKISAESGRPLNMSVAEFATFIKEDEPRWAKIFAEAGIKPR